MCQAKPVEGAEKSAMPLPAAETNAVDLACVVKPRIFCFGGIEVSVVGVDFLSNFEDEMSREELLEALGVRLPGLREHVLMNELINWAALHLASWSV